MLASGATLVLVTLPFAVAVLAYVPLIEVATVVAAIGSGVYLGFRTLYNARQESFNRLSLAQQMRAIRRLLIARPDAANVEVFCRRDREIYARLGPAAPELQTSICAFILDEPWRRDFRVAMVLNYFSDRWREVLPRRDQGPRRRRRSSARRRTPSSSTPSATSDRRASSASPRGKIRRSDRRCPDPFDFVDEIVRRCDLWHDSRCAGRQRSDPDLIVEHAGDHDHFRARIESREAVADLQAADVWQVHIHQGHDRLKPRGGVRDHASVGDDANDVALEREDAAERLCEAWMIVGDQDAGPGHSDTSPCPAALEA